MCLAVSVSVSVAVAVQERRSVMAALEDGVENMMKGGDTVYIIEEG
jgi:hypothetical protein